MLFKFTQDRQEATLHVALTLPVYFAVRTSNLGESFKMLIMFFCWICPQKKFLAVHHSRGHITGDASAKSNSYRKSSKFAVNVSAF